MFRSKRDAVPDAARAEHFPTLRRRVHDRLIRTIEDDGGAMALTQPDEVRTRIREIVEDLNEEQAAGISDEELRRLEKDILEELSGMGPLAPLMLDHAISDILVNGPGEVWVDRGGRLERTELHFDDDAHLRRFLDRIVSAQGRHLDATSPMVDAKLSDGSRLHAVIPPLCARGAIVSIRRFRADPVTADELVSGGFLSQPMLDLLALAVSAGRNLVIAGSAAAGKTTLLNVISRFVPATERIVTIEETAELQLDHPHVIPLESRPANAEGRGGVNLRDLVRTALRMRADRIIVGEVRGAEVMDMLQAMNVGHDGSLTTVHANSPQDVLRRLEALAHMGDAGLPRETLRDMIGSAIHLIVQVMCFRDGSRRVTSLCELRLAADELQAVELFRFKAEGVDDQGRIVGHHEATDAPIQLLDGVQTLGFDIPESLRAARTAGA